MMTEAVGKKRINLVRLVQERELSKKAKEEERQPQNIIEQEQQQDTVVPYLPKDCVSNILIRMPTESLPKSMLVCKPWYNIITGPTFINSHFSRSESVLVFQKTSLDEEHSNPPAPIILFGGPTPNRTKKVCTQFIEFREGTSRIGKYKISCSGKIRAACNGLLLIDNTSKKGGLIVLNPVTRKSTSLPVGTLSLSNAESYGFAYSDVTGDYKVVHLFRDELRHINCEILNVGAKFWKEVNGPAFGLFGSLRCTAPVSSIGALHWIPQINHSDYLVSMELVNEKFHTVPLPKSCGTHDGILEMGGFLSFVTHEQPDIDIWILKGLHDEVWTKHHRISTCSVRSMVPMLSLKIGGDMIFKRKKDGSLHAYDFKLQLMRKVEGKVEEDIPSTSFPHVNSLVWWEKPKDVCD
ncbi:hypothetical protein SLEP1_g37012 [Rubroshorea leprosula]|uniref:F-box domain-containing protein n=1 Tax=Rubroshorea leprosula TaxID=152421 RepID=A0AAV5KU01_9ROSI|nr:hypothetical protein SLEP1_g37012 [Rubroshorea leprosula]